MTDTGKLPPDVQLDQLQIDDEERWAAGDQNGTRPPPPDDDAVEAELDAAHQLALDVERETRRLRVRDLARDKLITESVGALTLPSLVRLEDFLAVDDDPITHRVTGLWPLGGRVVLSAAHKSGKTTLVANLTRALVDDDKFLGAYSVAPVQRLLLLDDELDERMLRRWLRDQHIATTDAVELIPLRGRLSTFNILDPATRSRWAEHLGPADLVVLDCLRPILDAVGLDENHDAGRFLEALDELTTEAGISDTLVVHHMGHSGERSRGDSRILDWPDAVWKLVRDAEEERSGDDRAVFFTAYGRDVDQPETLLVFDSVTRRLAVGGGTRRETRLAPARAALVDLLDGAPDPMSGRQIEDTLREQGLPRDQIRDALKAARADGTVLVEPGPNRAQLHFLNPSARECADGARAHRLGGCAGAPVGGAPRTPHVTDGAVSGEHDPAHPMTCTVCDQPLAPVLVEAGEISHPNCDDDLDQTAEANENQSQPKE